MNLLFRTDASLTMGTGHVMRCIALAQAAQDAGGRVVFAMAESTAGVQTRLAGELQEVLFLSSAASCAAGSDDDAQQTIALARERAVDWIVVDGYQFTALYQRALKAAGFRVLFIDDYGHASHYWADLVLNQNAYAREKLYAVRESYVRLLLGTDYCLLRREFVSWRGRQRHVAPVGTKILVTMGGSDPGNFTATAIAALCGMDNIEATVVAGGSNPHLERLQRLTAQRGDRFRLVNSVANMPELIAWADLAVASAGTTCWEMCLLGLPMILVDLAENQKPIARALSDLGAATYLGSAGAVSEEEVTAQVVGLLASKSGRAQLSERCSKLVDGRGAERVLGELKLDECMPGEPMRG
jgi:UDP-2,4-diacetamido-2,4,6-trideoxy-beta-L-altropyranose hydrolase